MSVTAQLVASSHTIALWLPDTPKEVWVCVIFVLCFLFNNFNVRRYGEIEYWLTVIKVTTVVGIIIAGILLPMNASPNQRLLGTDANGNPVLCSESVSPCVDPPGFNCTIQVNGVADSFKTGGRTRSKCILRTEAAADSLAFGTAVVKQFSRISASN